MFQEEISPLLGIGSFQKPQRIHCQLVMCPFALPCVKSPKIKRHPVTTCLFCLKLKRTRPIGLEWSQKRQIHARRNRKMRLKPVSKRPQTGVSIPCKKRLKGIEPSSEAWEASVLPLHHSRIGSRMITDRQDWKKRKTGFIAIRMKMLYRNSPCFRAICLPAWLVHCSR